MGDIIEEGTNTYLIIENEFLKGEKGDKGEGLVAGGTQNQALIKNSSVNYDASWKNVDKAFIGLSNVDNTSDLNKPISTSTQQALDTKSNIGHTHDDRYYTEAEANNLLSAKMNLDGSNSNIDELHFDITPTSTDQLLEGQLRWNAQDKTLDIGVDGANIVQQVGMETYYPKTVNNDIVQINDGDLVMYNGTIGGSGQILIKKATTNMALPGLAMGIATENIAVGQQGKVTWFGLVRGIQTNGANFGETWVDGTIVYNSATVAGGLSKNKPLAPKSAVMVGVVVNAHATNGILFVRPQYFPFVSHLSDANIVNPEDKQVLMYNFTTKVWENKTIPMPDMSEYYTKTEVDNIISSVYKYKGSVATYAELPLINEIGDVYNVLDTENNYAWTGTSWDLLGGITPVVTELNDGLMTSSDFIKLQGIEANANNYVLPIDVVQDANYVHTDNNYTTDEKNKLAGIAAGAEVNVNADWNATTGDAQILNKPNALNYKGYVSSVDGLPSTGQPSGLALTPNVEFGISPLIGTTNLISEPIYSNYFVFSAASYGYSVQIETDYPEMVKATAFASGTAGAYGVGFGGTLAVHIDYDPAKPVYYKISGNHGQLPHVRFTNIDGTWNYTYNEVQNNLTLITNETIFGNGSSYDGNYIYQTATNRALFVKSNMSGIKFWYNSSFSYSGWSLYQALKRSSSESYYYNDGMLLFEQSATPTQLQLVGNQTTVKEGDTYIVGTNNDIYVANDLPQWELWSKTNADTLEITDTGSYFTSTNVEGALQEVGTTLNNLSVPRWTDLNFPATQIRKGALDKPDFDETNIGLLFPQNDITEKVFITCQMPHSYKEGTAINPHIHCIQTANLQATFVMEYKWYNIGDTEPTTWTTVNLDTYGSTYTTGSISQVIEPATMIDGTGKKISSILKIKLYRNDNTYTGDLLVDHFDIHYQEDTFGSVLEYMK